MPLPALVRRAVSVAAVVNLTIIVAACAAGFSHSRMLDFEVFWNAGLLANSGQALSAWVVHIPLYPPFPYPPPFLLLLQPLALMPLQVALCLWLAATFALFTFASQGLSRLSPAKLLAFPPTLINGIIGQTGLLTAAMFMAGARWLGTRPALAGAMFGAMIIKPQLGLLIPFALLAGREWRAIAGAIAAVIGLAALSALIYGPAAFGSWVNTLNSPVAVMTGGGAGWEKMVTLFAALRLHGMPTATAAAVHLAVALLALVAVVRTWAFNTDPGARCAVLACGTALASPYLYLYDLTLLILPVAWCHQHARRGWLAIVAVALMIPAALLSWFPYSYSNPAPLASLLLLALAFSTSEAAIRNQAATGAASRTPSSTWASNCAKLSIN